MWSDLYAAWWQAVIPPNMCVLCVYHVACTITSMFWRLSNKTKFFHMDLCSYTVCKVCTIANAPGTRPIFLQLYIHDHDELNDRMAMKIAKGLNWDVMQLIMGLRLVNTFVRRFRAMNPDHLQPDMDFMIRADTGMLCFHKQCKSIAAQEWPSFVDDANQLIVAQIERWLITQTWDLLSDVMSNHIHQTNMNPFTYQSANKASGSHSAATAWSTSLSGAPVNWICMSTTNETLLWHTKTQTLHCCVSYTWCMYVFSRVLYVLYCR